MINATVLLEILAIGYTAFIWISLFGIALFGYPQHFIANNKAILHQWIPAILPLSAIFAYQIGWLIDYISYLLFYYVLALGREIKLKHIDDEKFWLVYTTALQKGSPLCVKGFEQDSSIARFTRSGFFNSLLIGLSIWYVALNPNVAWVITGICIFICIACYITFTITWEHWFCRFVKVYEMEKRAYGPNAKTSNYVFPLKKIVKRMGILIAITIGFYISSIIHRFHPNIYSTLAIFVVAGIVAVIAIYFIIKLFIGKFKDAAAAEKKKEKGRSSSV
jgi:hypothetical protein